jgi:hypothetical protein
MRPRWRWLPVLVAAAWPLASCAHPPPSPAAPTERSERADRGLILSAVPEAMPLAQPTPATDYAMRHYAHRIAVTIGIDAYARPWPRLHAAVNDAQRMAALLRAMGFDQVERLEDARATREAILDLVERRLPELAGEGDLVVVFFAGHGGTSRMGGYIVPRDGSDDLERTAISLQRLKESALRTRARHTLFVMDACFSGVMLRRAATARTSALAYWEAAAQDRVVQILTAGQADELVQESGGWGRFSHAVHDGLAGAADEDRDGVVTTEELATYADARVQREAGGRQHPQWGTLEGRGTALLLDVRRLGASARPAAIRRPVVRGLEAPLRRIHGLMERRAWLDAERALRDLMIARDDAELRLLLAEIYLEWNAPAYVKLIDTELRRAAEAEFTEEQRQRWLDLRARLDQVREPL